MRIHFVLPAVLAAACAQAPVQQVAVQAPAPGAAPDAMAEAEASIRPRDFYARIGFLASDALEGRDTPSPGLEAAAAYIASEFHRFGMSPAGDPASFIQRWPYTTRGMDVSAVRFEFTARGASRSYTHGSDYYATPGLRGSFRGGLAFVGTRVPPAAVRGSALQGRAAILVPGTSLAGQDLVRARAAADSAGAGALIVVLTPDIDESRIRGMGGGIRGMGAIPVFFLRHDRARSLFADARQDFDALTAAGAPQRVVTFDGVEATLHATVTETVHQVPNVAGIVEGSDPQLKNTYVVFSAHMDHTGICAPQAEDRICNGADDDASGTAAIIELAEAFSMLPVKPKRSLLFLAVSGEEKGLLGSRHFADNPTVPIESIVANVNIDMIGRNNPDSVVVIGQQYSSLGPLLHRVNERLPEPRMTISDDLWPEQRFFFRSDHFNFARRDVPAIFFFTGVHEDYHRPSDTVDRIDLGKITRITRLIFHYAHAIADDPNAPQWDPEGLEEVRRLVRGGR